MGLAGLLANDLLDLGGAAACSARRDSLNVVHNIIRH